MCMLFLENLPETSKKFTRIYPPSTWHFATLCGGLLGMTLLKFSACLFSHKQICWVFINVHLNLVITFWHPMCNLFAWSCLNIIIILTWNKCLYNFSRVGECKGIFCSRYHVNHHVHNNISSEQNFKFVQDKHEERKN